jgi:hypothetical protein
MQNNLDLSALAAVYEKAQNVVCFIHPQATYDAIAAALSLRLAFKEAGKSCDVICEEPMRVEFSRLVDIDSIRADAGNRDLVLSFAYSEEQVDKVSYNVDEDSKRFELVISPKTGGQPLDPGTIEFRRSGLSADVIFLFGYHGMAELGGIYEREKYAIDSAYSVAVTQNKIPGYAKLHLTLQPEHLSYSELVYFIVRQLQIAEVKDDLATNLLAGVEYATDRLMQPNISPRTFETVANLMRRGARRDPANPAFQFLGQPIRQSQAPQFDGEPEWNLPSLQPKTIRMGGDSAPVFSGPAAAQFAPQAPAGVAPQTVSASDFARAMSNRT